VGEHAVLQSLALDAETAARAHSSSLDEKTDALVCIGALVAMGAAPAPYLAAIERAFATGASTDEIVDTLVAVAATVGSARVVTASSGLAAALGYDLDAAFEEPL
jgi:alkylhydroperoxidase/carboxymuconolactone decarboxylase family protein YurZ